MRTVWCAARPGRHSPPQSPSLGRLPCDPRPLLGPPVLDLPACDSRHLPSSCSQTLHLEARFRGRRTPFSTRRHLQITFGTSASDLAPSPEHPRLTGGDSPGGGGCRGAPPLEQPGQPRSIRHPAVGRGLARRPARPLLLPLPGAAATAPPRFKARLYLALHLPRPPPLQAPLPHRGPSRAGLSTAPRPSSIPPPGHAPAQPPGVVPFPRPRGKARGEGSTWPPRQVKLFASAASTGGAGPSPSASAPQEPAESERDFRRPALAHLLLPDSAARGPSQVGRREREGRSRGRAEDPKPGTARCLESVRIPGGSGGPRLTAKGDAGSTAAGGLRRVPRAPRRVPRAPQHVGPAHEQEAYLERGRAAGAGARRARRSPAALYPEL